MRTLQRFATVCFIGAAFAALFSACSSSDTPTTTAAAGAHAGGATAAGGAATAGATAAGGAATGVAGAATGAAGAATGLTGNATTGATEFDTASCSSCHGTMGEGSIGPNITGSKTFGIGNWTEATFQTAVRTAKNPSGQPFNALMVGFNTASVSDQGLADIYAFLIAHPVETANAGSVCTPGACTSTH